MIHLMRELYTQNSIYKCAGKHKEVERQSSFRKNQFTTLKRIDHTADRMEKKTSMRNKTSSILHQIGILQSQEQKHETTAST